MINIEYYHHTSTETDYDNDGSIFFRYVNWRLSQPTLHNLLTTQIPLRVTLAINPERNMDAFDEGYYISNLSRQESEHLTYYHHITNPYHPDWKQPALWVYPCTPTGQTRILEVSAYGHYHRAIFFAISLLLKSFIGNHICTHTTVCIRGNGYVNCARTTHKTHHT